MSTTGEPGGSTSNSVDGTITGNVVQAHGIGSVTINPPGGPWWRRRTVSVEGRVARVRAKVLTQWQREVGNRGLQQPRPVRLRWRSPDRPLEVPGLQVPLRGALSHDVTDPLPVARELVEAFRADSRRQLVVLGAPGAGKTTLAILYTLAAAMRPDHPVPVLLSIAGWRPRNPDGETGEPIETWVARHIADEHPELTDDDGIRQLWAGRRLLPVLDGLDEMPEPMLAHALADLDRSAGAGLEVVLTCRTAEYERGFGAGNVLSHAVVVDIEPVSADDAAVYLTQREPPASRRWEGVVDLMRREPDGPLAATLSTPLMISLARQVYRDPASDPAELTRFATADAAGRHLLARYLPSVYPGRRERARSTRWLSFLAHHLRDRVGDPNYEWWRLARSVPIAVLAAMIVAAAALLGAVLTPAVALIAGTTKDPGRLVLPGVIVGVTVGAVAAVRTVSAGRRPGGSGLLRAIGSGVVRDVGILLTTVSALGVAALGIGYLVARPAALTVDFAVVEWLMTSLFSGGAATEIPFVALGVITAVNGLGVLNGGLPQRSSPRLRLLVPNLLIGLAIGVVVALPPLAMGFLFAKMLGLGIVVWALVAALVGVPIGLARWLANPAELQESSSPRSLLRWDRRALLVTVAANAVTGAAVAAPVALPVPRPMSLFAGVVIAALVLLGSGTAWLTYTLARTWLALTGRLPWRLERFLRDAHTAGVLRQTGPAYQLRHDLLTDHLADHWRRPPAPAGAYAVRRRHRPRRRKLPLLVVALVSLTALAGSVLAIYLTYLPRVLSTPSVNGYKTVALSLDGRMLAIYNTSINHVPIVQLRDTLSGHLEATLETDPQMVTVAGAAFNADGTDLMLFAGSTDDNAPQTHVVTWAMWRWRFGQDPQARRLPALSDQLRNSAISAVAFSPDGNTIAIGKDDGTVQEWDLTVDQSVGPPSRPHGPATSAVHDLAYSTDGRQLGVVLDDGSVTVLAPKTHAVTGSLPAGTMHPDPSRRQSFGISADGRRITALDGHGVAALWDVDSGTLIRRFDVRELGSWSFVLSSGGSAVAISRRDGTIELHDLATGDFTKTLRSTERREWLWPLLVFAPDDRFLAAAGPGLGQVWGISMP